MSILVSPAATALNLSQLQTDQMASVSFGLIMTNLSPDTDTDLSALHSAEATFDDYTLKMTQTFTRIKDDSGNNLLVSPNLVWVCNADQTVSNTIYGYFCETSGSVPQLLYWELFATPQAMALDGDSISFVSQYSLPAPTGQYVDTE